MDVMSTIVSTKHNYCKYGSSCFTSIRRQAVSTLTTLSRNGVMRHSALPHIWKPPTYPAQVHPFILSLLERFELSFPVSANIHKLGDYTRLLRSSDNERQNGEDSNDPLDNPQSCEMDSISPLPDEPVRPEEPLYLIPSLLPEVRPLKLATLWPLYVREGESVFGRCYRFEFIPKVTITCFPT